MLNINTDAIRKTLKTDHTAMKKNPVSATQAVNLQQAAADYFS